MTYRGTLRLAVVSEGPSDFLILRSVIEASLPGTEVVPLHPEVPLAAYPEYAQAVGGSSRGTGWRGVEAWCRDFSGKDLELFMRAVVGQEYDGIVVHLDASMAQHLGIEQPCPPVQATTDPLRKTIVTAWLRFPSAPPFLVLATPSKSSDAWVVAAHDADHTNLECLFDVEALLMKIAKLRRRGGQVKKPRALYEPLARKVGKKLEQVCSRCSEAGRFVTELRALAASL